MSFAIVSSVNAARYGAKDLNPLHLSDKGALAVDALVIGGGFIVGALVLASVIQAPYSTVIGYGTLGAGVVFGLIDIAVILVRQRLHKRTHTFTLPDGCVTLSAEYFKTNVTPPTDEEIKQAKRVPCHKIINNLYLGDASACAQIAPYKIDDTELPTNNPNGFETVITLCQLKDIQERSLFLADQMSNEEAVITYFGKKEITWFHLGRTLADQADAFMVMVHDATYPDSKLAKTAVNASNMEKIIQDKKRDIAVVQADEWFEPVFQEIDKAVEGNTKVLVHCQAGRSRSPTLLAAYLIKRYELTPQEAIAFLTHQRPCVDIKFMDQLQEYYNALYLN